MNPALLATRTATLPNGLRVVAHEDASSPLVAVHVMYNVGSRDEQPGRTGLAHLLEHLLFEGTEHVPKGAFDALLERVGGTNNGSTWLDRTAYHQTVPCNAVELALWLERDRMLHFLDALDPAMLETQRDVVLNERLEAYDNRPYGLADQRLHELLFAPDHPYSWPIIGYAADLQAISLDEIRAFFEAFYNPANAVLVVGGDIAPERAFDLAARYFGDVPSGPASPRPRVRLEPPFVARDTLEDAVSFPRFCRAYAVPPFGTPEWVALDVLAYLLADGESSRLGRSLIRDRELAQDVDAYLYPTALAGVFGIVATARSGIGADALENAVDELLNHLADGGATPDEVAGAVRRARRDQLAGLATIEGRAEELAHATTVLGSAERLAELLASYAEVSPAEVQAAASLLTRSGGATLAVVPRAGRGLRREP